MDELVTEGEIRATGATPSVLGDDIKAAFPLFAALLARLESGAIEHAVLLADDDGRYCFASAAACELLGRPLDEVLQLSISDVAGDGFDTSTAWKRFLEEGFQSGEFPLKRPDGTILQVEFSAIAHVRPGRHVSMLRNIHDRKHFETRLLGEVSTFSTAFFASPAPTSIRVLSTGEFIDVNGAFSRATGYWRPDLVGKPGASDTWKNSGRLEAMHARLRSGAEEAQGIVVLASKEGFEREFNVAMRRIRGEDRFVTVYWPV